MGFVDNNLMAGERVVYRTHLSKAIFILPAILAVPGLFMLAWALKIAFASPTPLLSLPLFVFSILLLSMFAFVYIKYITSEFAVTNKRVLIKLGLIRRETLENLLQKIEGIHVEEGLLGRIFNYGTIFIKGTGGTSNPFKTINAPFEFRKQVQEQIEKSLGQQPVADSRAFCAHCGAALGEGAKFCGKCGKPVA